MHPLAMLLLATGLTGAPPARRACAQPRDAAMTARLLDRWHDQVGQLLRSDLQPTTRTILRFTRELDLEGAVASQVVGVDSSVPAPDGAAPTGWPGVPTEAVRRAIASQGYRHGPRNRPQWYPADITLFLDERMASAYCIEAVTATTLRLVPAGRRGGRVEVETTIHFDSVRATLTGLDFRYVGLDRLEDTFSPSGRVVYRTAPNGALYAAQWVHRVLVDAGSGMGPRPVAQPYIVQEIGGEVATMGWSDGTRVSTTLGRVQLVATSRASGRPVAGAVLHLQGSGQTATSDRQGRANFTQILPGPYRVAVDDPVLRPLGLTVPTGRDVQVRRGAVTVAATDIPGAIAQVTARCPGAVPGTPNESWVLARIVDGDGHPLTNVRWTFALADDSLDSGRAGRRARVEGRRVESDGVLAICRGFPRGAQAALVVRRSERDSARAVVRLDAPLVTVRLVLPTAADAPNAAPSHPTDSVRRAPSQS